MDRNDPRLVEHLDIITAWGEASAANDTPPAPDEQLWAATRSRTDAHLPEQIDSVLLADLRAAFNAGRWPASIDLDAVAAAVNARGVTARVRQSSGGTATLYTGEETLDGYGDVRFSASAGPGYFDGPARSPTPTSSASARTTPAGASASRTTPPPRTSPSSSSRSQGRPTHNWPGSPTRSPPPERRCGPRLSPRTRTRTPQTCPATSTTPWSPNCAGCWRPGWTGTGRHCNPCPGHLAASTGGTDQAGDV